MSPNDPKRTISQFEKPVHNYAPKPYSECVTVSTDVKVGRESAMSLIKRYHFQSIGARYNVITKQGGTLIQLLAKSLRAAT